MTITTNNLNDLTNFTKAYWNGWGVTTGIAELVQSGDTNEYHLNVIASPVVTMEKALSLETGKLYEFNIDYRSYRNEECSIKLSLGSETLIHQILSKSEDKWVRFEGLFKPSAAIAGVPLTFKMLSFKDADNIHIKLVPENELTAKLKQFENARELQQP